MLGRLLRSHPLVGRVILITGGGTGIGRATALACAARGMRVIVSGRRIDKLEQVAGEARMLMVQAGFIAQADSESAAVGMAADVDDPASVADLFQRASDWAKTPLPMATPHQAAGSRSTPTHANQAASTGGLDAVFANAGFGVYAPIAEVDESLVRSMFQTNFYGTLYCAQHAVARFRQRRRVDPNFAGRLLICASALSEIALPNHGIYSATKAAQDALASALRAEVAAEDIFVSSIHPIGTRTEFFDTAEKLAGRPAGRSRGRSKPHTPEQVAGRIIKCLRRPKAEVWPSPMTRLALAVLTAWPGMAATVMARVAAKRRQQ